MVKICSFLFSMIKDKMLSSIHNAFIVYDSSRSSNMFLWLCCLIPFNSPDTIDWKMEDVYSIHQFDYYCHKGTAHTGFFQIQAEIQHTHLSFLQNERGIRVQKNKCRIKNLYLYYGTVEDLLQTFYFLFHWRDHLYFLPIYSALHLWPYFPLD